MVKMWWRQKYIRKGESTEKGDRKKRKETEGRILREESEQYYFLYKLSLLERTCGEPDTHLFLSTNLTFPCNCPRAKPSIVISSLLLQILLVWAKVERHNPLF